MTKEDKDLLLKDLSARLTYGVKAYVKNWSKLDRKYYEGVYTVESVHPSLNNVVACSDKFCVEVIVGYDDYVIKPYLFPMSEMTKEQDEELKNIYYSYNGMFQYAERIFDKIPFSKMKYFPYQIEEFFNKNHIDYRGLIEKELAIDATNKNIY